MTNQQEDTLSRYLAIQKHISDNNHIWINYVPFVRTFAEFKNFLDDIQLNRDVQMVRITGSTLDKNDYKSTLIDKTWYVCTRVQSYAGFSNNDSLLRSVKITRTALSRSSATNLVGWVKIIHQKASENKIVLEPYGVTPELLNELETLTSGFTGLINVNKDDRSIRKNATAAIKRLFTQAHQLLISRLDLDSQHFKNNFPEFFMVYTDLRGLNRKRKRKKSKAPLNPAGV
jgi:hypothetical protein